MSKKPSTQAQDIGYIKAKVENLEGDMKDVKECLVVLRDDAAFRRKIKRGLLITVAVGGTIFGVIKTGDFSKISEIFSQAPR